MANSSRVLLIKIHMLLAAFILPAAFMFLVTGGLYTWGFKGTYASDVHLIELDQPLTTDAAQLKPLIERELNRLDIGAPTGSLSVKKGGTSFKAEWTGSKRDVVLEPTADTLSGKLTVKETSWYRNLVQLHKAKGGQLFKVYAAVLAISLFVLLATGFTLALQVPAYRKSAISVALAGAGLFVVMVFLS